LPLSSFGKRKQGRTTPALLTLALEGGDIPKSGFSTGGGIKREINLEDMSFWAGA
jgi:hypothetical protein